MGITTESNKMRNSIDLINQQGIEKTIKLNQYPNHLLTKLSYDIEDISEYKDLLESLQEYVEVNNNIAGIALPQMGILKRAFIARLGNRIEIVINPEIVKRSPIKTCLVDGETSLTYPNEKIEVYRSRTIKVNYLALDGKTKTEKLAGLNATIFQHLYDHLEGILLTDYE